MFDIGGQTGDTSLQNMRLGANYPITSNTEVIGSSAGLVPRNALVLTGLATFRVVGQPEVIPGPDLFGGPVSSPLLYSVGLSEADPPPFSAVSSQEALRIGLFKLL